VAVIHHRQHLVGLIRAVQRQAFNGLALAAIVHRDVIKGFPVAVVNLEFLPGGRQARGKPQVVDFQMNPKERFGDQAVHPASRAGIPSPSPTAGVLGIGINIGGNHVRFDLVDVDSRRDVFLLSDVPLDAATARLLVSSPSLRRVSIIGAGLRDDVFDELEPLRELRWLDLPEITCQVNLC